MESTPRKVNKDKQKSYLYFLYKIQEYFVDNHNTLKKKRLDSLVFLLEECNELFNETDCQANCDSSSMNAS